MQAHGNYPSTSWLLSITLRVARTKRMDSTLCRSIGIIGHVSACKSTSFFFTKSDPTKVESIVDGADYRSSGTDGLKPYTTSYEYCLGTSSPSTTK
jgi:hypothetical protein